MLEIARLDDGAIVPRLEAFDIAGILGQLINEFQTLADRQNIRMRAVSCHCIVRSDKLYLRRIIQNLISNAIKYAQQGQVLVGCRRTDSGLRVQVLDTGSGIPEDKQKLIFNDFYRLRQHQQKVSGAGLGLGVVSRLCKLLELPVTLESELSRFTRVSVLVPYGQQQDMADVDRNRQGSAESEVVGSEIDDMVVFCVDDEFGNLDALARLLSKWQCHMVSAETSEEALALAKQQEAPDVILMDFNLNDDVDGIRLIERLRAIWQEKVPAAIVTASPDPQVHARVKQGGMQLLHKPLKPAALKALLRHFRTHRGAIIRPVHS